MLIVFFLQNIKILHKNHFINVVVIDWALFCSSYQETLKKEFHLTLNSIPTLKIYDWCSFSICPLSVSLGILAGHQLLALLCNHQIHDKTRVTWSKYKMFYTEMKCCHFGWVCKKILTSGCEHSCRSKSELPFVSTWIE